MENINNDSYINQDIVSLEKEEISVYWNRIEFRNGPTNIVNRFSQWDNDGAK